MTIEFDVNFENFYGEKKGKVDFNENYKLRYQCLNTFGNRASGFLTYLEI